MTRAATPGVLLALVVGATACAPPATVPVGPAGFTPLFDGRTWEKKAMSDRYRLRLQSIRRDAIPPPPSASSSRKLKA